MIKRVFHFPWRRRMAALLCLGVLCLLPHALADEAETSITKVRTLFDELYQQEMAGREQGAAPAPSCSTPGCNHLAIDAEGNVTAVCALGRWLLSAGDSDAMFLAASKPAELTLSSGDNYLYRSGSYRVTGGDATSRLIVTAGRGVSILLENATLGELKLNAGSSATLSCQAATVRALTAADATLELYEELSFATLTGTLTLTGGERLLVGQMNASLSAASDGNARVVCTAVGANAETWLRQNWRELAAPAGYAFAQQMQATYYGKAVPLCFIPGESAAYAPLPAPPAGQSYRVKFYGNNCQIELTTGPSQYLIGVGPGVLNLPGDGIVTSVSGATQNVSVNAPASLEWRGASTSGSLTVAAGVTAHLRLYGSSTLGALVSGAGSTLRVSGRGAVAVRDLTGAGQLSIHPQTNFGVPASVNAIHGKLPTRILISGNGGQPVRNRELILKIGGTNENFMTTTDADGLITLWRDAKLTAVDAVALSGNETYAAIIAGGAATADALPEITSFSAGKGAAGEVLITVRTTNAQTVGVQYLVDDTARDMNDLYAQDAERLYAAGGKVVISGVKPGQVVTFRAFAAKDADARLTAMTTDAFAFSKKSAYTMPKETYHLRATSKTYDGDPFDIGAITHYPVSYRDGAGRVLSSPPVNEGAYTVSVSIPDNDPRYVAGTYSFTIHIARLTVYVYPFGDMKLKGERDPQMLFFTDPLIGSDTVAGRLRRMPGEGYGNYPYYATDVYAQDAFGREVDHYEFRIAPDSPYFFIDWNPHHFRPFNPLDAIDPVFEELHLGDGSVLKVQRRTSEVLNLGGTYFGTLVTDTPTGKARPFTPSLRVKRGRDEALLILTAEAELGGDGGYETDMDGNRVWRGRTLTLGNWHVTQLSRKHIRDVALSLGGATVLLPLDELTGDAVKKLMDAHGISKANTVYCVELEPVTAPAALAQGEKAALAPLTEQLTPTRVKVYLKNGKQTLDISAALPGARLLLDAGALLSASDRREEKQSDVTETVNGRPVEAKPSPETADARDQAAIDGALGASETDGALQELAYTLLTKAVAARGYAVRRYHSDSSDALDSAMVVPYTASEDQSMLYTALMRTRPFLMIPLRQGGLYGLGTP